MGHEVRSELTAAAVPDLADIFSPDELVNLQALARQRSVTVHELLRQLLAGYVSEPSRRETERRAMAPHIPPASALQRLPTWQRMLVLRGGDALRFAYRVTSRGRYRIGPGLIANHRLQLRGSGRIEIGCEVNAWSRAGMNRLDTRTAGATIRVGDRVRLNGAQVQAAAGITVGDDCILGACTLIDTDYHSVDPLQRRSAPAPCPITIGTNVWIGGAAVLKGVSVGDNSVVGLGSVVTQDVPAGVLVAGNPARVVRPLLD